MDTVNLTLYSKEYKDFLKKETRNKRKGFGCNVRKIRKETRKARRKRETENSIKVDSLKTAVVTSMANSTIPGLNFIPSGEKPTSLVEPCNDGKIYRSA